MNITGLFMLADKPDLIREIQRRIYQRSHWLIPIYDLPSRDLAETIILRYYSTPTTRLHFQAAVFPDAIPSGSLTIGMGAKEWMRIELFHPVLEMHDVFCPAPLPPAVVKFLDDHFCWAVTPSN